MFRAFLHSSFAAISFCSGASDAPMRAMWIYKTDAIMASEVEQAELFEFCRERKITDLFWQVHFSPIDVRPCLLENTGRNREFLRAAHDHALRVHALTGDPSHTRRAKHSRVLDMTDALIEFNKSSPPEARFDGLHLDVEPHGLPQWKGADVGAKCALLTEFVELHHLVAVRLRDRDPAILFGSDVVFWLDKKNSDGSAAYPVTFRGIESDAAKHLLGVVDNVAIMSYRNTTEGRNGILSLVAKTINHADTTSARVFVGVKMADIGPEMESFFGRTESEMMNALKIVDDTFAGHPGYAGLSFFHYEAFKVMP